MVLSNSRRYDESIGAFNESIKLDPYFCSAWDLKGFDLYSLNKYDNALEAYEKAIQLDPGDGLYWNDKGDALKASDELLSQTRPMPEHQNLDMAVRQAEPRPSARVLHLSPTFLITAWRATLTSPPIV